MFERLRGIFVSSQEERAMVVVGWTLRENAMMRPKEVRRGVDADHTSTKLFFGHRRCQAQRLVRKYCSSIVLAISLCPRLTNRAFDFRFSLRKLWWGSSACVFSASGYVYCCFLARTFFLVLISASSTLFVQEACSLSLDLCPYRQSFTPVVFSQAFCLVSAHPVHIFLFRKHVLSSLSVI